MKMGLITIITTMNNITNNNTMLAINLIDEDDWKMIMITFLPC